MLPFKKGGDCVGGGGLFPLYATQLMYSIHFYFLKNSCYKILRVFLRISVQTFKDTDLCVTQKVSQRDSMYYCNMKDTC